MTPEDLTMNVDPDTLSAALNRLRRAQGQLAGVIRMIEYVTPAASEIVPTMKMTMPMRPRTVSMPNLE